MKIDFFEQNNRCFTLIELLVVVTIIGILAAIAIPNFLNAQIRAKVSKVKSDIRTMSIGLEQYQIDHNNYPSSRHPLINPGALAYTWKLTTPIAYLSEIPKDLFVNEIPENLTGGIFGIDGPYLHYISDPLLGEIYVVFSYAPDNDMEFETLHYDSSNGIISNGDIYRVGAPQ